MLPTVGFAFHLGTIYLVKVFFGFKGPDHLQLVNKNHITNFGQSFLWAFLTSWLDSTQLDQGLAQLSSKYFLPMFGSTQLSSMRLWLDSAQLEKMLARNIPNNILYPVLSLLSLHKFGY